MRYQSFPSDQTERQETTRERAERQRRELRAELTYTTEDYVRWAGNRDRVIAERQAAAQQAYDLTEPEWQAELEKTAREYKWDTSEQENVSLVLLLMEEAEEYLEQLQKDTHGRLGYQKDIYGLVSGLNDAKTLAKELGGLGALAKAVDINGVPHIVIENYNRRYLDLGTRWQQATAQILKMGQGMNSVKGNVAFFKGGVFVELAFSGAINAVDYMLHDEKTMGDVVGQFSTDVIQGLVGAAIAQGVVVGVTVLTGVAAPTAVTIGAIAAVAFGIGKYLSAMDEEYQYSEPMKQAIKDLIDGN